MNPALLEWGWPLARALVLLAAGWYGGRLLRGPLGRFLDGRIDPTLAAFLVTALQPACVLLALPPALDALHVSMSSALAVLSTAGLAIALALRDSLSNVASGGLLLTARPFRVGDLVTIAGVHGTVRRIGLLLLEIDAEDGRRVSITNDKVLGAPMERHAADGRMRVELQVRAPTERVGATLLDEVRRAAEEAVGPGVEVVPLEVDTTGLRFVVRVWAVPIAAGAVRARLFAAIWPLVWPNTAESATILQHR